MKYIKLIIGSICMSAIAQAGIVSSDTVLKTFECSCVEVESGPGGSKNLGGVRFKVIGDATSGDADDVCRNNYRRSSAWSDIYSRNCHLVNKCN